MTGQHEPRFEDVYLKIWVQINQGSKYLYTCSTCNFYVNLLFIIKYIQFTVLRNIFIVRTFSGSNL